MMISSYKAPIDDSIFVDLSLYADDLMTSDHEKLDSEKEWDALVMRSLMAKTSVNDQFVLELYSLKDSSSTDDYLSAIDDYLRCDEHLDDLNLEHLDDIDLEHEPKF
ncbi:hypothetical protein KY285_000904 [Solanum tuberosum]|nr:hypothetical protein KY285_000904 [Solanum tuberosum]